MLGLTLSMNNIFKLHTTKNVLITYYNEQNRMNIFLVGTKVNEHKYKYRQEFMTECLQLLRKAPVFFLHYKN